MDAEIIERLKILRRIGERGLKLAQRGALYPTSEPGHAAHLDLWQHLLDELKRVPTGSTNLERTMESKSFSTAALASISSGMLLCPFSDMHEAIEYLMGHPVWTHELASQALFDLMKSKLLEQHPGLPRDAEGVTDWQAFLAATCAALGESLTITKGEEVRAADPITTARAAFGPDKPIIAMGTD